VRLHVLCPASISDVIVALLACDLDLAQAFKHKSVQSHCFELLATHHTTVGLLAAEPRFDTVFAEELVACATLLGILHDALANATDEVVVDWLVSTPICVDIELLSCVVIWRHFFKAVTDMRWVWLKGVF
jgi:hypothetical protein